MAIKAADTITVVRIADGTSVTITSTSVEYQKSSSGTAKPSTWQSTIPDVPAGQYLWTKTTVYYSNGKSTVSYSVAKQGSTGAAGKGIKSTTILYAKSSSNTAAPSSGWQGSVPATDSTNKYLWTKTTFTYTDNTTSTSYTVGSTLDGMSVGGRNLFKCSSMINERLVCDDIPPMNSVTLFSYESEGYHIVTPSTGNLNNGVGFYFKNYSILGIHAGDTITFSFDVKGTSDSNTPFMRIHMDSTGGGNWWTGTAMSKPYSFIPSSEFTRVSMTWTIPENADTFVKKSIWFAIHGNHESDLYIRYLKLEKGNIATDWTPAPEDAVAVVKQQYYLSTSTTSATGGTWLDTVPELKENTCIWTRTATIHGSGVIAYSTPILDSVTKTVVQTAADIKQTNTNLTLVASRTSTLESGMTDAKKRLDTAEASIKVNSDAIELKVNKNGIVSAINQTSESVKIQASKISLEGLTTINNLFKVNTDGSIEATNAVISGKITASTGTIGGWRITADALDNTNSKGNYTYFANGSNVNQDVLVVRTGAGTTADPYRWPVIVRATGQAIFDNANITGNIHATTATIDEIIKMKDIGGSTVTVLSAGVSVDDPHSLWINPWGEIGTVRIRGESVEIGGNFNVAGGSAQFDSDVSVAGELYAPCIELSNNKAYIDFHQGYSTADFTSRIIECSAGVLRINSMDVSSDDRLTFTNHKGGFYMIDDYWVRVYGSKNLYCDQTIRSSKGIQADGLDDGGAQFRAVNGNYGFMIRNDGANTYFLLTYSGDQYGQWHNVFPFYIQNSDGHVFMSERTEANDLYSKDWSGTFRKPVSSANTSGKQIAYIESRSGGSLGISGQYGGSKFAVRTIGTSSSDIRLKTHIKETTADGLAMIRRIRMKQFDWVDAGVHQPIGFIADELEALDTNLSIGGGYEDDGTMNVKSVNEFYLMGYAIKGIQELDTESSVQKDRIRTLEAQLDTMRVILDQAFERIAKLEKQL